MDMKSIIPYVLITIVLIGFTASLVLVGQGIGNANTRNELQKWVGILTAVNSIIVVLFGLVLYWYINNIKPESFMPFTLILITFNIFLSLTAVSISVLQQSS